MAQEAEAILKKYNPNFLTDIQFADEDYAAKFRQAQNVALLINSFAFLAIFISCMGLLGLSAYMVENKTKEIGIRKVLGASIGSINVLLARDFATLILLAILIASPLAWFFMYTFLQQFSYRTSLSPWILASAGAGALTVALITVSFQTTKAAMVNPIKSLRTEWVYSGTFLRSLMQIPVMSITKMPIMMIPTQKWAWNKCLTPWQLAKRAVSGKSKRRFR